MTVADQTPRLATANVARFLALLPSCTGEFQRRQLEGPVIREVARYETLSQSQELPRNSVI